MASGLWQKLNEYKSVFFEEKSSAINALKKNKNLLLNHK
jgi:hypothetical protein